MGNSTIALKPIKDLLGTRFFIPNYQRGYRWTAQQATDLLEDILAFALKERSGAEIYCIQPLVVQKRTEDICEEIRKALQNPSPNFPTEVENLLKGSWNVVDGQQRLTTIHLILSALGEETPYHIQYDTRGNSAAFLQNIHSSQVDDAAIFENIDFFHIYNVYKTANQWLKKHETQKEIFKTVLLEKVNFIWYEIVGSDNADAIAAFTRLNVGKIPLTDAELIKALFLNRTNFECASEEWETQQRKIAMEWDRIECTLQDNAFWLFLHGKDYTKPTRIDFILDMICKKGMSALQKETPGARIADDEHKTFRYYYHIFNREKMSDEKLARYWGEIRKYFQIFNEWYHDYELYHYVGYLTTLPHKESLICELVDQWHACSKKAFVTHLRTRIANILNHTKGFRKLDDFIYEQEKTDDVQNVPKTNCVPILLLHNVETIIQQNNKLVDDARYAMPSFTRFPFHLYKAEKWEVEHIRPNAGEKITTDPERKTYLQLARQYWGEKDNLRQAIDRYLGYTGDNQDEKDTRFEQALQMILQAGDSLADEDKNKIWNYTLLDEKTNQEYSNAIFPVKRAFLANKERGYKSKIKDGKIDRSEQKDEIAFVLPCTRNVFAKFYTDNPNGLLSWTEADAKAYLEDMKQKLDYYTKMCGGASDA